MEKKWLSFILVLALVFALESIGFRPETGRAEQPGSAGCNPQAFKADYKIVLDLWVRSDIPKYSFRTGEWFLADQIGLIKEGTEVQVLRSEEVGFTQLWLEVCYRFGKDIGGGKGHWIWAGNKDSRENVISLTPSSGSGIPFQSSTLSFVNEVWAQGDIPPGKSSVMSRSMTEPGSSPRPDETSLRTQLDNPMVSMMKYSGIYLLLFFGMATGSIWEWLAPRSSEKSDKKIKGSMLKLCLRLFIGSIISFSFFIGPVMGIGAIGFTFSSAILAFHFGLVHSDPTDLVRSLKQKSA